MKEQESNCIKHTQTMPNRAKISFRRRPECSRFHQVQAQFKIGINHYRIAQDSQHGDTETTTNKENIPPEHSMVRVDNLSTPCFGLEMLRFPPKWSDNSMRILVRLSPSDAK